MSYLIHRRLLLLFVTFFLSNFSFSQYHDSQQTEQEGFKENKGQVSDQYFQARPDVLFYGETNGLSYHIKKDGISYQLSKIESWKTLGEEMHTSQNLSREIPDQITIYRTDIQWINFNNNFTIEKGEALSGYNNYYTTVCEEGVLNVRSYKDITYKNLYDGVDLKWYEKNGELEYDFIVSPGKDYKKIRWAINGANKISIGEKGQLIISTPLGEIVENAPLAYQGKNIVKSEWLVDGNEVSFKIGKYNEQLPLIIDPVVVRRLWATYFGGNDTDYCSDIDGDPSDGIYMSGSTRSTNAISTTGAYQTTISGQSDAYVTKFNSNGNRVWSTYYGGNWYDEESFVAHAGGSSIYLVIYTSSSSGMGATTGQTVFGGSADAFIVKLDNGVKQWGTYYGGNDADFPKDCVVRLSSLYIVGETRSTSGISTSGAHQTNYGGNGDGFICRINSNGAKIWATYYGGSNYDRLYSAGSDGSNLYFSGHTGSTTGISTSGAYKTGLSGGGSSGTDAFLIKFNSSGVRSWGTYYGGTGSEFQYGLSLVEGSTKVAISGSTNSTSGIATSGAHQTSYGGGSSDAYFAKFSLSGSLEWATYYGGFGDDYSTGLNSNSGNNIYLSGSTQSNNGISTSGTYQESLGGSSDAFLSKFNNNGVRKWGTYYGGVSQEGWCYPLELNATTYLAGSTYSSSQIATPGSHDATLSGTVDAFLVELYSCPENVTVINDTVCHGNDYIFPDGSRSRISKVDTSMLSTSIGCDSIIVTNLFVDSARCPSDTVVYADYFDGSVLVDNLGLQQNLFCNAEDISFSLTGATNGLGYNDASGRYFNTGITVVEYNFFNPHPELPIRKSDRCSFDVTVSEQYVSINEYDKNAIFSVFPNPSDGDFRIRVNKNKFEKFNLKITDAIGNIVYEETDIRDKERKVKLSEENSGLYFILISSDVYSITKSIVIN